MAGTAADIFTVLLNLKLNSIDYNEISVYFCYIKCNITLFEKYIMMKEDLKSVYVIQESFSPHRCIYLEGTNETEFQKMQLVI